MNDPIYNTRFQECECCNGRGFTITIDMDAEVTRLYTTCIFCRGTGIVDTSMDSFFEKVDQKK